MIVDHSDYLKILRRVRELPGVKKVFIRSGIRFDYLWPTPTTPSSRSWWSTMSPAS